jgi:hypothetical protein
MKNQEKYMANTVKRKGIGENRTKLKCWYWSKWVLVS